MAFSRVFLYNHHETADFTCPSDSLEDRTAMVSLYPLRFEPIYRHYLWGGRRLELLFDRQLASQELYAESWEIVDHGGDQSVVQCGPLAGRTLHDLVEEYGATLLGQPKPTSAMEQVAGRFPLLIKLLDADQNLSMQVHPDDAMAARLDPPDLGKTEAWYVLATEPGGRIYAGLKPGVDRKALAQAIQQGTCDECVHWFEPTPGDCLLIPAGTVHALGAGVMVAEIQQASDTTFRLFDWNRLGPDGKPRDLHVEQGLEAIDFDAGPADPICISAAEKNMAAHLIECEYFSVSRWELDESVALGGDGHCHVIIVLEGSARFDGDPAEDAVSRGRTILLPAALPRVSIVPLGRTTLLDVRLP